MSDPGKTTLNSVDWARVRMFSKEGKLVHVMTDEGPLDFEFATETEANDAVEEYFRRQEKPMN